MMRNLPLFSILLFLGCIVICCSANHTETSSEVGSATLPTEDKNWEGPGRYKDKDTFSLDFATVFNDSNYRQYAYAEHYGIKPIENFHDAYYTDKPIVKIENNEKYQVAYLTHSVPYLVPKAAGLLEEIAQDFIDSVEKRGGNGYKVIVTSLLRTPASVKQLRKVNINSTDSSCHKFATTFDLSYTTFAQDHPKKYMGENTLKTILAQVLFNKRNEGKCMVKFENKTNCFHITATK